MASKIEQIIEEMEDFVDNCSYQKFSSTNIIVERERLEEYLRELRTRTPDEIKQYQRIISNKEAILNDARQKADAVLNDAKARADAIIKESQINRDNLVSQHEVMQRAYAQADEVTRNANAQAQQTVDQAMIEANSIRESAMKYLDDMLAELQGILHHSIETARAKYGDLITQLDRCAAVVDKDRAQLYPQMESEQEMAQPGAVSQAPNGNPANPGGPGNPAMNNR
ncbi:MAG: hypothetical protein IJ873_05000 [Lachnospiraceae bacterium]|nr:hypothetical protein [Lachnospiraceae bacterium]MBR2275406.1 hypothetical protein [Lachnospiraceae bacterium]